MLEQSRQIHSVEPPHSDFLADSLSQDSLSIPQRVGVGNIAPKEAREHGIVLLDLSAEEHPAGLDLSLRLADKPYDPGRVVDLQTGPASVNVAEPELFRETRSTS